MRHVNLMNYIQQTTNNKQQTTYNELYNFMIQQFLNQSMYKAQKDAVQSARLVCFVFDTKTCSNIRAMRSH